MKIEKTNEEKEIFLRMNQLRGALAVVVMLSHIWGYTGFVFLVPFNKIVTIAVGFFFFLSGWGMMQSYYTKKKYTHRILGFKIPFLLWMSILAYLFSVVLELILISPHKEKYYIPIGIKQYLINTNWYVYELLAFYVIFIFVMSFIGDKYKITVVGVLSVIAFVALFYSGVIEAYYNSIICFWFGMICGKYGCIFLMDKYPKGYFAGWVVLIVSFIGMFLMDRQSILFAVIRNVSAIGAIVVVLYIIRYLNINSKLMRFASSISPEIYFYHMPIALILNVIFKDSFVYMIVVIISSIFVAIAINPINTKIKNIIKGVQNNEA